MEPAEPAALSDISAVSGVQAVTVSAAIGTADCIDQPSGSGSAE